MAYKISEWLSEAVPVKINVFLTWLSLANGEVQVKLDGCHWLNLSAYLTFIVAQPGDSPEIVGGPLHLLSSFID